MFKFNFDVEDDVEKMGSLDENCTTQNYRPASAQAIISDSFTELSLAKAVCPNTAHLHYV
jgi:hypothetical protein